MDRTSNASSSEDELALEDNPASSSSDDELQLEGNSDAESLQLEGNSDAEELLLEDNDESDDLSLQLENNELEQQDEEDGEDLELQVNDHTGASEDKDGGAESDSSDDTLGWKRLLPARTTVLEGDADHATDIEDVEALTQPPDLPPLPADESLDRALPQKRAAANPGTALMQVVGVVGSHRPPKTPMVDELAREGSTLEEGLHPSKHSHVLDLCHRTMVFHTSRLLADSRWCDAYARAAEAHVHACLLRDAPRRQSPVQVGVTVPAAWARAARACARGRARPRTSPMCGLPGAPVSPGSARRGAARRGSARRVL